MRIVFKFSKGHYLSTKFVIDSDVDKALKQVCYKYGKKVARRLKIPYKELTLKISNDRENWWNWYFHGAFTLLYNGDIISKFKIYTLPGCCGTAVSAEAQVMQKFCSKGVGTLLNKMRIELAKEGEYGSIMCTDISDSINMKVLATNQWKEIDSFINPRTGAQVKIFMINLKEYDFNSKYKIRKRSRVLSEI